MRISDWSSDVCSSDLVTVDEDADSFPATSASEYLSRHGIASELHEWPRNDRTVEDTLIQAIRGLDASYLIMGAYGRSRLRETLFGGVTKCLMSEAPVPLLVTHCSLFCRACSLVSKVTRDRKSTRLNSSH